MPPVELPALPPELPALPPEELPPPDPADPPVPPAEGEPLDLVASSLEHANASNPKAIEKTRRLMRHDGATIVPVVNPQQFLSKA